MTEVRYKFYTPPPHVEGVMNQEHITSLVKGKIIAELWGISCQLFVKFEEDDYGNECKVYVRFNTSLSKKFLLKLQRVHYQLGRGIGNDEHVILYDFLEKNILPWPYLSIKDSYKKGVRKVPEYYLGDWIGEEHPVYDVGNCFEIHLIDHEVLSPKLSEDEMIQAVCDFINNNFKTKG